MLKQICAVMEYKQTDIFTHKFAHTLTSIYTLTYMHSDSDSDPHIHTQSGSQLHIYTLIPTYTCTLTHSDAYTHTHALMLSNLGLSNIP